MQAVLFAALLYAEAFVPEGEVGPPARTEGRFEQAPVFYWERRLPGEPLMAASHTERGRPATDGTTLFMGSASLPALLRFDLVTGSELQRFDSNAPVQAEPVLDGRQVYFTDTAGYTYRFQQTSEIPAWEHFGGAPILSSPTLHAGQLYVASVDDVVYALDAQTGALRWRYEHPPDPTRDSELTLFGAPSPLVVDGLVLVGFSDGALVALDTSAGEPRWERRVGEGTYPDLIGEPLAADGDIYVAGFSEPLVALDMESRSVRWRLDFGGAAAPAIDGEQLFHGGSDGKLRGIDRRTGQVLWTWDSETSGALSSPQVTDVGLIVSSSDGSIYLVDRDTGALSWEWDPIQQLAGVTAAPLIVGRQLVAVSNSGKMFSLLAPQAPTLVGDALNPF